MTRILPVQRHFAMLLLLLLLLLLMMIDVCQSFSPMLLLPGTTTSKDLLVQRPTTITRRSTRLSATRNVNNSNQSNNSNNNNNNNNRYSSPEDMVEGETIGSGSYGTVHILSSVQQQQQFVGKRPWSVAEMQDYSNKKENNSDDPVHRAQRSAHYWQVEEHCFRKLTPHPQLPPFRGTYTAPTKESEPRTWMIFDLLKGNAPNAKDDNQHHPSVAPTLGELMKFDAARHHDQQQQKEDRRNKRNDDDDYDYWSPPDLHHIATALGIHNSGIDDDNTDDEDTVYEQTLDRIMESLLTVLVHVHDHDIVHRDIKPDNLLVVPATPEEDGRLVLVDFGSAADLQPSSNSGGFPNLFGGSRKGLEDRRVAVSPIYAAPELFIDVGYHPKAFDVFSTGLLFCQLLFGYLEERIDAGFHRQLEQAGRGSSKAGSSGGGAGGWDLNSWLSNEMGYKLKPGGLEYALTTYVGSRPGMWKLLTRMLSEDPARRPTAAQALARFERIMANHHAQKIQPFQGNANPYETDRSRSINKSNKNDDEDKLDDGPFLNMVLESLEYCAIPTVSRALQYVATLDRKWPLGLVLSERDEYDGDGNGNSDDHSHDPLWKEATKEAMLGDVFVKEVIPGGQAEAQGVIEVGDRLHGVGEFLFPGGGFERAMELLQMQPSREQYIKLHFDRVSVRNNDAIAIAPTPEVEMAVRDYGAFSTVGKRPANEDEFVLHELHDAKDQSILVLGVFDGHAGKAASSTCSAEFPNALSERLLVRQEPLEVALEQAWDNICTGYRNGCQDEEACIAEYDPREGLLMANTGSIEVAAGTTATVLTLNEKTGQVVSLNCGDSRSLVVSPEGRVQFATRDHTPESEADRFIAGRDAGLDYSIPVCGFGGRWSVPVGDYVYALGRSLEGPMATYKGIVSTPDVVTIPYIKPGSVLLSASDGLWEVMDSNEVARQVSDLRQTHGVDAAVAAKVLCQRAVEKGTRDNVSAVVVYT